MKYLAIVAFALFIGVTNNAFADAPAGFEDPELLAKVMAGEIVVTKVINTDLNYRAYQRAFANKVSAEAYIKIATNHAAYPTYFKEVQSAKTTKQNAELTEFEYWADVIFKQGIFSYHLYPEGKQTVTYGKDAVSESTIDNRITNYADKIILGQEITRLIPYEGGILIEDFIDVKINPDTTGATTVKTELVKHVSRFLPTFRKALGGDKP